MYWINVLHFYLSPNVDKETIKEVVSESYRPLLQFFKKNPKLHLTINLTACLTENLATFGYSDIINDFKILGQRKQLEFTDCAAYHPILPLIPESEIIKQIKANHTINKRFLGKFFQPSGFFLPESAYHPFVGKIIKKLGYQWIILDQVVYPPLTKTEADLLPPKPQELNDKKILSPAIKFQIKSSKLLAIFRQRKASKTYVPKTIFELLKSKNPPKFLITATDAELYGHRHYDRQNFYQKIIKNKNLKTLTVSEYLKKIKSKKNIEPSPGSWESSLAELKQGQPFILWQNPKNLIQKKLWQLANLALKLNSAYKNKNQPDYFFSCLHLEKGLSSCTFWWASNHDFKLGAPPAWGPEEVEKGALELVRSLRALIGIKSKIKLQAEEIFLEIEKIIWRKNWQKI